MAKHGDFKINLTVLHLYKILVHACHIDCNERFRRTHAKTLRCTQ